MITSRSNKRVSSFLHFYTFQALLCFALRDPFGGTRFDLDNQTANRVGRFLFPRQNGESNLKRNRRVCYQQTRRDEFLFGLVGGQNCD